MRIATKCRVGACGSRLHSYTNDLTVSSTMVVNASSAASSQSVDRLVGTAAIIGLSLALAFQWITGNDDDDGDIYEQEDEQQYHDCYNHEPIAIARANTTAVATATSSPSSRTKSTNNVEVTPTSSSSWWWPITLMTRRRKKKRRKRHYNNNNSRNGSHRRNTDTNHDSIGNNESIDHLGSCECGSIQFIVSIY